MGATTGGKVEKARGQRDRLWTHGVLALLTVIGCQTTIILDRSSVLAEPLAVGLGYVALVYIGASLLIGPLYLARQRRNPVNLYLRRDIGIWAGLTTLLHVFFSFQLYNGGQVLLYFFSQAQGRLQPLLDLFGLSNDVGLLATLLIVLLLVLSNDLSLRWLKGPRWKQIQRLTYPAIVLAIVHTVGFQFVNTRDGLFGWSLLGFTLLVLLAQGIGVLVHLRRQAARTRTPAPVPATRGVTVMPVGREPAMPQLVPVEPDTLSRRQVILAGGAAIVGAMLSGLVGFRVAEEIFKPASGTPPSGEVATPAPPVSALPPALPTPDSGANAVPTAPAADTPVPASPTPAGNAAAPPVEPSTPVPVAPTAPVVPPTATAAPSGAVLARLSACPMNSALTFTTPDTGESGILIHEADGSVKAFNNVCTHRPYPVEYDPNNKILVCPLHYALFNAQTGDVTQGPARRPLTVIPIHLDDQGNIIYG